MKPQKPCLILYKVLYIKKFNKVLHIKKFNKVIKVKKIIKFIIYFIYYIYYMYIISLLYILQYKGVFYNNQNAHIFQLKNIQIVILQVYMYGKLSILFSLLMIEFANYLETYQL